MRRVATFIIFILLSSEIFSQKDSLSKPVRAKKLCEVEMTDGATYKGYIEKQTDSLIFLRSSAGVLVQIPKVNVTGINFHGGGRVTKDSVIVIHSNSIASNYYVTGLNAHLFREKKFYGSGDYFAYYHVNYAFSRNFSAGISTFPFLAPLVANLRMHFELSPKLFFGIEAAGGTMSFLNPRSYGAGGVLRITTGGDDEHNFTFFAGYGDYEQWLRSQPATRRRPAIKADYYVRYYSPFAGVAISLPFTHMRNTRFVSEAFYYPNINLYSVSAGIRTYHRQRSSLVVGLNYIGLQYLKSGSGNRIVQRLPNYFALPYIGFSFRL